MVEIKNLSHEYVRGIKAIENINLHIERGKKIALIGSNGSGKSTLLNYVNCLYIPKIGEVLFDGIALNDRNADKLRMKTGYLFDNPDNQLFCPTVKDDIGFGFRNLHNDLSDEQINSKCYEIAEKMSIVELMEKSPMNLSLGQKKKVAIAGILINNPDLLIMDEPFSGLDHKAVSSLNNILADMESDYKTQLISTHDLDFVYDWADEIIVLHNGKLVAVGDNSILNDENWLNDLDLKQPILSRLFSKYTNNIKNINDAQRYIEDLHNN